MGRNQLDKYINQLDIKKENILKNNGRSINSKGFKRALIY
jgi:hypothetical protein